MSETQSKVILEHPKHHLNVKTHRDDIKNTALARYFSGDEGVPEDTEKAVWLWTQAHGETSVRRFNRDSLFALGLYANDRLRRST